MLVSISLRFSATSSQLYNCNVTVATGNKGMNETDHVPINLYLQRQEGG